VVKAQFSGAFLPGSGKVRLACSVVLVLATVAVFMPTGGHDFVNYDDNLYVTSNEHVQRGLTGEGVSWAFTNREIANWHPVTWLSHMLDVNLFGMDPRGHHLTSVLIHAAGSLLLFLTFSFMTGSLWPAFAVAVVFALHPLHVESVAWVAQRKDVLAGFFWMASVLAYSWYVRKPGVLRYLAVVLPFILGMMSKPVLVSLPLVLLLLDYWPLQRWEAPVFGLSAGKGRLLLEKAPLALLSMIMSFLTFHAQKAAGALTAAQEYPLAERLANVCTSYVLYIRKSVWPSDLAVFYPFYGRQTAPWHVPGAVAVLVLISLGAFFAVRKRPYYAVGWLWYIVTLVPVIGFVQVGGQAMADRYAYIPLVGLSIVLAWGVDDLVRTRPLFKKAAAALSVLLMVAMALVTWRQVGYWKNSVTLFRHAIEVTTDNWRAYENLGSALATQGKVKEAQAYFSKAYELNPYSRAELYVRSGNYMLRQGRTAEAIVNYRKALEIIPYYEEPRRRLEELGQGAGR
jgi:tetratricopeptide (TPR) repeat protein